MGHPRACGFAWLRRHAHLFIVDQQALSDSAGRKAPEIPIRSRVVDCCVVDGRMSYMLATRPASTHSSNCSDFAAAASAAFFFLRRFRDADRAGAQFLPFDLPPLPLLVHDVAARL